MDSGPKNIFEEIYTKYNSEGMYAAAEQRLNQILQAENYEALPSGEKQGILRGLLLNFSAEPINNDDRYLVEVIARKLHLEEMMNALDEQMSALAA
jgi:hypothetical protein